MDSDPGQAERMNEDGAEIVLVEDNLSDVELITRTLQKSTLVKRIVVLRDGAEASHYFFGNDVKGSGHPTKPKLVLLDLKLPKVDGIEVLRRLKADPETKGVPVVVLTSSEEEGDLEAAYDAGANSFVTKPIVFNELAGVIGELQVYWFLVNKAPDR